MKSKVTSIRIPDNMLSQLKEMAEAADCSLSAIIIRILKSYLNIYWSTHNVL